MRFSFTEPASIVLGDEAGVLTLAVVDSVLDPEDFTFEWALLPWSGADAEMDWAAVTPTASEEVVDPVLNISLYDFTLPLAKSDVPEDLDPDYYYLQVKLTGDNGVTYILQPRSMGVTVYPAPVFAGP